MLRSTFSQQSRLLKKYKRLADEADSRESWAKALSNEQLEAEFANIGEGLSSDPDPLARAGPAFALVREAARRELGQRLYPVQLIGGLAIADGKIAEMKTGEGKTLTATAPAALASLRGRGVHIVTINDYLAERDANWMRPVYELLGLSVAVIKEGMSSAARRRAYAADITYGTNSEFGFDYLRDNIVSDAKEKIQRFAELAIIDEVDSILIDEARTPLILNGPPEQLPGQLSPAKLYRRFAKLAREMEGTPFSKKSTALFASAKDRIGEDLDNWDYEYDEKLRLVAPTDRGNDRAAEMVGAEIYEDFQSNLANHLRQAITAEALYERDRDYTVVNRKVFLIDPLTGRVMEDYRWSNGLHQAVEAKEGLPISAETQALATISYQNFFRRYPRLAGMTGTAKSEEAEFNKIYKLETVQIPPERPVIRVDHPDRVYKTAEAKWQAVIEEVISRHERGQPVLIGTASVEHSEQLSRQLKQARIKHGLLNARPDQAARETEILAVAGGLGQVTVATNMAGRGADIRLGGANPDDAELVCELGGLYVLGSERHEARRIDDQLRGRSGRQGDPGESVFYVSAEDPLVRLFAGDKLFRSIEQIQRLTSFKDSDPLEFKSLGKGISAAQQKVEEQNFLERKILLEYDDVINKQRELVYGERDQLLEIISNPEKFSALFVSRCRDWLEAEIDSNQLVFGELIAELGSDLDAIIPDWLPSDCREENRELLISLLTNRASAAYQERVDNDESLDPASLYLAIIDQHWRQHLIDVEYIRQGIHWRSLTDGDPIHSYRIEVSEMIKIRIAGSWADFSRAFFREGEKRERRISVIQAEPENPA